MRTIKFKCWDGTKMWKHAVPLHSPAYNGGTVNVSDNENGAFNKFVKGKLLQFTGLKDTNGTEIYEGDLVECKTPYGELVKEIVWDSERCGFFMKSSFVAYDSKNLYKLSKKKILVVGNIYETPTTP